MYVLLEEKNPLPARREHTNRKRTCTMRLSTALSAQKELHATRMVLTNSKTICAHQVITASRIHISQDHVLLVLSDLTQAQVRKDQFRTVIVTAKQFVTPVCLAIIVLLQQLKCRYYVQTVRTVR